METDAMAHAIISDVSEEIKDATPKRKRKRVAVNNADLIGRRFGSRVVLEVTKNIYGQWACVCECLCDHKKRSVVLRWHLLNGKNTNCGCLRKYRMTHAMTGTPTYYTWDSMIQRCTNPHSQSYADYGGRGIKCCDRWRFGDGIRSGFECFLADMGERPSAEHSLDRINVDGDYEPGNCRWATVEEQQNNRRDNCYITWHGQTKTLKQWSEKLGIKYVTLQARIKIYGWSIDEAFTQNVNKRNNEKISWNNATLSIRQWEFKLGLNTGTLQSRLDRGWSVERALSTPVQQKKCRGSAKP
jgi:hypothetical protein